MALNDLFCADVPLRNYSLTHTCTHLNTHFLWPFCEILRAKAQQNH